MFDWIGKERQISMANLDIKRKKISAQARIEEKEEIWRRLRLQAEGAKDKATPKKDEVTSDTVS